MKRPFPRPFMTLAAAAIVLSCAPTGLAADSSRIVFTSVRDGNWEIYSMNADGTGVKRLTRNSGRHTPSDGWARWSPDGTRIAYMSDTERHGTFSIYVMNADGGGRLRLTPEPPSRSQDNEYPAWSPDGSRIAYVSPRTGLHVMSSDGSGKKALAAPREGDKRQAVATCDSSTSWSPDGKTILFAVEKSAAPGDSG